MGISYGGISQLFTAQTNPPSLAAISPLSVIDATQTTLYPGGILNTGFARRLGQGADPRRQAGVSQRGQRLGLPAHPGGRPDLQGQPGPARPGGEPPGEDPGQRPLRGRRSPTRCRRSRSSTRSRCRCSWPASGTDEQTGGHCPTLAKRFTGTQRKWFTFTNGTHVDSLDPETFNRWYDFLQLYVAKQAPITNSAAIQAAGAGDLPGGDGDFRGDDAARSDPAAADLRGGEGRLRAAQADPHPVRQRGRRLEPGQPHARLRAVVLELPHPGHHRPLLVPRGQGRRSATKPPARAGADSFDWNAQRPAADQLHGRHGRRHGRPVDRDAALRLAAAARRQRGVLPDRPAERATRP